MTSGSTDGTGEEPRAEGAAHKHRRLRRHHHEDLTGQPRRGHPWWVTALILLAVFVVGLAVWFAPTFATSSTSYCSSCKTMKPAYETWQKSVHSDVDCLTCHVEPGTLNKLRWRQGEAIAIWSDYLGSSKQMSDGADSTPTNAACEQCHDIDELPPVVDGIKMPHQEHTTSRNLDCIDCHSQIGHSSQQGAPPVSMATCSMCHNGAAASDDCVLCHVTPPVTEAHPPAFAESHGAQANGRLDDCLRCHHDKAAFCDACHARPPASHFAGDWRYGHGTLAAADNAACVGCHDSEQFCEQCHKVTHPKDWVDSHGAVAAKGDDSCLVCHPRSMCDECHSREGVNP
jgi:nitrate/TMAO reductase-like tetraheme cytochrome c subunit